MNHQDTMTFSSYARCVLRLRPSPDRMRQTIQTELFLQCFPCRFCDTILVIKCVRVMLSLSLKD
jgi:hypothetical protein